MVASPFARERGRVRVYSGQARVAGLNPSQSIDDKKEAEPFSTD
jgi:hypothetical protein